MARGINFQTIEKSLSDSLSYEISFDFCQFLSKHKVYDTSLFEFYLSILVLSTWLGGIDLLRLLLIEFIDRDTFRSCVESIYIRHV